MHIAILEALACHGKLKLTHLMYKANINCNVLIECLGILIQHSLVERQIFPEKKNKRIEYAITEAGLAALKNVIQINKAIPIIEADLPNFTMLSNPTIES
jgi:predicted transcriptional regulator